MKPRITPPLALTLAVLATASVAKPFDNPSQAVGQSETINGVAIRPGIERLSYISPRYFGIRPTYDACVKQSHGAIPMQQDCAEEELTYQDDRLNRAYKTLVASLNDLDKRAATEAQRAWLAFRDKDCAARAGRFGSDAAPATESACRMESTAYRAQQLEDWRSSVAGQSSR
jgi:uncharacterized protein YecT (DUF1311 family)